MMFLLQPFRSPFCFSFMLCALLAIFDVPYD